MFRNSKHYKLKQIISLIFYEDAKDTSHPSVEFAQDEGESSSRKKK